MKSLVCFAAALVVGTAWAAPSTRCGPGLYQPKSGDTLWALSDRDVEVLVAKNPFLDPNGAGAARWSKRDGKTIALIYPDRDCLAGVTDAGDGKIIAVPRPLTLQDVPAPQPRVEVTGSHLQQPWYAWERDGWWLWPLLWLLGALALFAYLLNRALNKDPATSGPAMVPGGGMAPNADSAVWHFQSASQRRHLASTGELLPRSDFTVLSTVRGRIWGVLLTRYASWLKRAVPRRFNGEAAFQAQVRMPNGSVETLYLLQACGNELRQTSVTRQLPGPDFRFVPDPVAAPVAPVVPAAPVTAPAPVTAEVAASGAATQPEADATSREPEGAAAVPSTATMDYKPPTRGKPHLIQVRGNVGFSVTVGADGVTVRLNEPNK